MLPKITLAYFVKKLDDLLGLGFLNKMTLIERIEKISLNFNETFTHGKDSFKREYPYLAFVWLSLFALYVITMPRTVTLEDSGEFLSAIYNWGLVHPPGYPLYLFIGHLFTWIPVGSIAFRIHLFSAFTGAWACVFLYCCALLVGRRRLGALVAAYSYGFCNTFWYFAIVSKAYSLNDMIYFIILFLLLKLYYTKGFDTKLFYLASFTVGLSLTNHWPKIVLCGPAFLVIVVQLFKKNKIKAPLPILLKASGFGLLGLLPYIYVPIALYFDPKVVFVKIDTLHEFWRYLIRADYSDYDASGSMAEKWRYLMFFFKDLSDEFHPLSVVLALIGFILSWKVLNKHIATSLFLSLGSATFILLMFTGRKYSYNEQEIFQQYISIPLGITALYMGLVFCYQGIYDKLKKGVAFLLILASIPFLTLEFKQNYPRNAMQTENFAADIASAILLSMPYKANLFVHDDVYTAPLMYMSLVEHLRPDVTLYDPYSRLLGNRIIKKKEVTKEEIFAGLMDFIATNQPVFAVISSRGRVLPEMEQYLDVTNLGIVLQYRIKDSGAPVADFVSVAHRDLTTQIFDNFLAGGYPNKKWLSLKGGAIEHLCSIHIQTRPTGTPPTPHPYCIEWEKEKPKLFKMM